MKILISIFAFLLSLSGFAADFGTLYDKTEYAAVNTITRYEHGNKVVEHWGYELFNGSYDYKKLWTNVTTGSGSGAITISSNGSLTPGDTLFITNGTYASFSTITGLAGSPSKHITILPSSNYATHPVRFGFKLNYYNSKYIDLKYLDFYNCTSGIGIEMDDGGNAGTQSNSYWLTVANCHFHNCSTQAIHKFNNIAWSGNPSDTATMISWHCTFDSLSTDSCGQFIQGSFSGFSTAQGSHDVALYTTVTNSYCYDMTNGGGVIVGIEMHHDIHNFTLQQVTYIGYSTDHGIFQFGGGGWGGSGTIHDFYINGPYPQWIARVNVYTLPGEPMAWERIYNGIKTNSSTFGGVYIQVRATDTAAGVVKGGNFAISNVTGGNWPTVNTYYNYMVGVGEWAVQDTILVHNCVEFNAAFTAKTPGVIIDESGGHWTHIAGDTSNNVYSATRAPLLLDSSSAWPTYKPLVNSGLIGAGTRTYLQSATSYGGITWLTNPSIGGWEYASSGNPCNCVKAPYKAR